MAADLKATAERIVALAKASLAALSAAVVSDGEAHARYTSELFPYWTARIAPFDVGADSQDFDEYSVPIVLRLVIGHVTSGLYKGERDDELMTWIPHVVEYFNERELLVDASHTTEIADLESARVVRCSGYTEFANSGVGVTQVGTEFTLRCEYRVPIFQAFE